MSIDFHIHNALTEFLLRLGDDRLVLGHWLSEWCGHAPMLEEDIALTNIALDEIGQASAFLHLAGEIEGRGRSEDDLAYFREATQFSNVRLVEQPNNDFASTIARQFLFDAYSYFLLELLQTSAHQQLAGIAAKGFKEATYHLRHSREWMLRLGEGTAESHRRLQASLNDLWPFTKELFDFDETERALAAEGIIPALDGLDKKWRGLVTDVFIAATLTISENNVYMVSGSRTGKHSEHLGHMLAEMQIVARSFPGAKW
ncbi:MAG: 1,2-phenylacetyl-CoA epoxidase subunit PaaC [Bacteroidota bacterium]